MGRTTLAVNPWWDRLREDFATTRDRFDLTPADQAIVGATAGVDVLLRTAGAIMAGGLSIPMGYNPFEIPEVMADRDFYLPMANSANPDRFFVRPPRGIEVRSRRPRTPHVRPSDGTVEDLTFHSPYVPANPRERPAYLRRRRNRTAHARYWRHNDRDEGAPRPTIAFIHGFFADPYWLNEWFFDLPRFYEMGCDVVLFTLPFHGARQSRLSPYSGHAFFAGGISRVIEAFGQAIHDFRILLEYLTERRGATRVGVTGISLGGYTTALLAAVEERLAFAIPNVPVASIPDLVMEWKPMHLPVKAMLKLSRMTLTDVRQLFAVACPLTYAPRLPRERLMLVGGIGDRLAPPKHTRVIWEHWGRPRIEWFPGSHIMHVQQGRYLRRMAAFFEDIGFMRDVRL